MKVLVKSTWGSDDPTRATFPFLHANALREAAASISSIEGNPRTWLTWIVYLLARLEEKATKENPAHKAKSIDERSHGEMDHETRNS